MGKSVWAMEWVRGTWRDPMQHFQTRQVRYCGCCGFSGYFVSAKRRGTREFRCPSCASRPRDRQIGLIFEALNLQLEGRDVLHFAPEWWLFRRLKKQPGYVGGDILKRRNANAKVDITRIEFTDASFDFLVCNHVLEHVPEDHLAMSECFRVLRDDGMAIFSVPTTFAGPGPTGFAGARDFYRLQTWEPPANMPKEEIERISGWDHKRTYGLDFADRLRAVGFDVRIVVFDAETQERCRLRDEPIFLAAKQPGVIDLETAQLSEFRMTS